MKIEIRGKPIFLFSLTGEQLGLLIALSKAHYDSTCRAASERGGFIYGWSAELELDPIAKFSATWRQLDLCLKILEGASYLPEQQRAVGSALACSFMGAMTRATAATTAWNMEIEV